MGLLFSRMFSSLPGNKGARIPVIRLDSAGKITILYRFQIGEGVGLQFFMNFNISGLVEQHSQIRRWLDLFEHNLMHTNAGVIRVISLGSSLA